MRKYLQKIADVIIKIEKAIIIVSLPAMCIIILLNTFSRFTGLFTDYLIWAEELARYLMIGMAFIGAALVMQEDGHYKMTAIVDSLPGKVRKITKGVMRVVITAFMIVLATVGIECCVRIGAMGQASPVLKIPMWIPYAAIPVGMILGVIQIILVQILSVLEAGERREET